MAKGRIDRSSRLLSKVATAIDSHGEAAVEKHLDEILVSNNKIASNSSVREDHHRRRAVCIIEIICRCMNITEAKLRKGKGTHARLALLMSYYFIKNNTNWTNDTTAKFMRRNSHGSVTYGVKQILQLSKSSPEDKEKINLLNQVDKSIQAELKKLTKKNGHGK